MSYSSYDRDHLEPASTMRIERTVYFESGKSDISELAALSLEQLQQMREESAAAEQEVFDRLKAQAAAWEEQAGKTLSLNKTIEYVRTPQAAHTANQWEAPDEYRHIRSNAVYQMSYSISENTRYDSTAGKSIPYSWTLRWSIFTNGPGDYRQAKIAGKDRKVFASREELDKYLNGRIKAYEHLFTEIFPAVPQEYADCFKVNGCLLPGYTIEGQQAETKIDRAAEKDAPEPPLSAPVSERSDRMSELFSIQLHNRQLHEQGRDGVWLDLPTTTEKLQAALREIGITADNPQDFFINGYSYPEDRHLALPYEMVLHADVDELNFLAARLETLDAAAIAELNAALQNPKGVFENIGQIIDYADNVDYYVHLPDVKTPAQLGDYYLHRSGMVEMPEEWKGGIDPARPGQHVASQEQGIFTEYGYLVKSGDEWRRVHEGQPVPEECRVMAYPAPDVLREESKAQPVAKQPPAEAPAPVVPIILNGQNSADRMKEITDRLETGIQELFESERYKAYLTSMSRFHSYSFNNTLLIAMQGGQLVAGYNKWRDEFHRNVKRGEKGIKILAPAPFKTKKEVPKLDGQGRQIIGRDGKPVTEVQEVQVPAFKVVSVFDVSQTEGEPLPSLAVDELAGSVEDYQDFYKALEQAAPVPISFENIPGTSHGYYHLTEKRIAIQDGMSELQTLKTTIHEIAHAKLHAIDPEAPATEQADRPDSRTREVQAESVAYAVCAHYGLDTSDYSFGYVAGWSSGRDLKELKASLETIRATAHELITAIDGHLAELQQQRQAQQAAEQPEPPAVEQAAEQPDPDSVFSKLSPEQQREMTDSVKGMLQSLVEADLKSKGEVSQGTLEAIQTQGFTLSGDGKLEKAPEQAAAAEAPAPDPAAEPVVTILWSGSEKLKEGQQMPLSRADAVFKALDEAKRHDRDQPDYTGSWYDKTSFRIDFTFQGQPDSYEGRQDFGDGDGSLIEHIQAYHEHYAQDESWKNDVLHSGGPEAWEADKAQREMLLTEFIPYMKLHCSLSNMEREAGRPLQSGETLTPEETAYFNAVLGYVQECRPLLNQGQYQLPEPPKLSGFDQSLQDYQEQVRAEIAQEADAAGMTVEEYAAAGYEAPKPQEPEYIYQVHANPRSDSRENLYFLQAYLPQEDGRAKIGDVLYIGTPEKCRELMGRLTSGELTQAEVKALYAKEQEAKQPAQETATTQEAASSAEPLTDLQKKAVEIADRYQSLPLQDKIGVIAQAFGCKTGKIETSPCTGKWRGTSDISIRFDNGKSLFIGNSLTPKAKTAKVQNECVNGVLVQYNPEIVRATKEAALPALLQREAKDNAIAAQKGLKPYTILNVEFNDGADDKISGYMGWYYVTLAVDGNICAHMETGLNHDIADGKVSETPVRENYFIAGALKETDVDYVFNNVGFSSASDLYSLHIPEDVRERAEQTLAKRQEAQDTYSIYQVKNGTEGRDYRYCGYEELQAAGLAVDRQNYDLVYTAPLTKDTTLDGLYRLFNIDHPADYKGRSLSKSDVIVFQQAGQQTAYYVDDGAEYTKVPEFFIQREKQLAPDNLLTGETVQTPRGTFHVADMTREQMEAAGYGFHHQSEDGRYLIMGNGTQAFAIPAQQESPIKAAEMTTEQNTNMIDGVLNNAPTMGELEAKVKAGEQVSLLDVAEAAKAETAKNGQRRKTPQEKQKPSIRAQLKAAKEEQAKKPPAREKSKDLEV